MKKVKLIEVAETFEMINSETHYFYSKKTGEFDFYGDFMDDDIANSEKFEEDEWIAAPRQYDLNEYDIMTDFVDTVSDPRKNELLCVALQGKGVFRRFKDTLRRVDLLEEWYAFKRNAYIDIAREWCNENNIPYKEAE